MTEDKRSRQRVAIREGLLTDELSDLAATRLLGSRCDACGETALGRRDACPQCGRAGVRHIPLGRRGVLWTYTVARHRPPGDYKGPDPFEPFGLGLVELPEGLRVLSPILCDLDRLKIGMPLVFAPYVRADEDGREVVAFAFKEADGGHVDG